jgi:site-specific recombinase
MTIDREMSMRLPNKDIFDSPFYKLLEQIMTKGRLDSNDIIEECRDQILNMYPLLETYGVSIDLVYKLDTSKSYLRRIESLNVLATSLQRKQLKSSELIAYIIRVTELIELRSSLISFLGSNVNMIARKIIERTSQSGEHYITRDKKEYVEMFQSAAGGGFVTVFTTFIKSAISKSAMPLFFDGLVSGLNYSLSFIVIQLSHYTLATKTPAMTASTLASRLTNIHSSQDAKAFVDDVVSMVRSAFIAVLGNVGVVIPGVLIFDFLFKKMSGRHVFLHDYAVEQFLAHNPLTSLTIIYAIVTGFILWLSSIMGGWIENWVVYRQQIEIFEESTFFNKLLGTSLQKSIAAFYRRHLVGFATNICLGFLLSYSGVWGKFFGLPLQVRHVTLSAGTIAFSLAGIDSVSENKLIVAGALVGILIIGILNFSVSFSMSLFVAARARNIRLSEFPYLLKLIGQRFLSEPKKFFIP